MSSKVKKEIGTLVPDLLNRYDSTLTVIYKDKPAIIINSHKILINFVDFKESCPFKKDYLTPKR